ETGFDTIIGRGRSFAEWLPGEVVYAGFSLGVLPAQLLAQTRPGAKGALLFHACVPVAEFGESWPENVPVQVHGMEADPFFAGEGDLDAARALTDSTPTAELFLYSGKEHLLADASLPSYDERAAKLLMERALGFLGPADSTNLSGGWRNICKAPDMIDTVSSEYRELVAQVGMPLGVEDARDQWGRLIQAAQDGEVTLITRERWEWAAITPVSALTGPFAGLPVLPLSTARRKLGDLVRQAGQP